MSVGELQQLSDKLGRYRLLKMLGEGGMGAVYLAEDSMLGRQVALKVPHSRQTTFVARLKQEARSAATLNHPNICQVHDVGEVNGVPFITMAYIEGSPLSVVCAGRQLPQADAAAIVRKLALAAQEAHKKGVVHRDLKPANVMLNQRNEPIIMDFGLAHQAHQDRTRITQAGNLLGTPAYMSPEQLAGDLRQMGPSCDIYSLGVILYELLTGRLPFEGPMQVVMALVASQQPPLPPSRHRRDLDPELEAICLKAMAKKMRERFGSMDELATALTRWLQKHAAPHTQTVTGQAVETVPPVPRPMPPARGGRSPVGAGSAPPPLERRSAQFKRHGRFPPAWMQQRLVLWLGIVAAAVSICVLFGIMLGTSGGKPPPVSELNDTDDTPPTKSELAKLARQVGKPLPPERSDVEKAKYRLRLEHADALAEIDSDAKLQLVTTLRKAAESAVEPVERYARLDLAREVAVKTGDFKLALEICSEIDSLFYVKFTHLKAETLKLGRPHVKEFAEPLVTAALTAGFAALAAEQISVSDAESLLQTAETAANSSGKPEWIYQVRHLRVDTERIKAASPRVGSFIKRLRREPHDETANVEVGKFLCFVRNDWPKGLPMLARGSDPGLKQLAEEELRINKTSEKATKADAEDRLALGDQWWENSDVAEAINQTAYRERARYWYLHAVAWQDDAGRKEQKYVTALERIGSVPAEPVALRIRLTGLVGTCNLEFSNRGLGLFPENGAKPKLTVNHLEPVLVGANDLWANSGTNRLFAGVVDFSTAQVKITSAGKDGTVVVVPNGHFLKVSLYGGAAGSECNFDLTATFGAAGYSLPNRMSGPWTVKWYKTEAPSIAPEIWQQIINGEPIAEWSTKHPNFWIEKPRIATSIPENFGIVATAEYDLPAGRYRIQARSASAFRISIDDTMRNEWNERVDTPVTIPVTLDEGTHRIRVEYVHAGKDFILQFHLNRIPD